MPNLSPLQARLGVTQTSLNSAYAACQRERRDVEVQTGLRLDRPLAIRSGGSLYDANDPVGTGMRLGNWMFHAIYGTH